MAENQEVRKILINQYKKQFLLCVQESQLEQAITFFVKLQQLIIEETDLEENIYNLAGLCYYRAGKWKEARTCFKVSYEMNSSNENKASQYVQLLTEEEVKRFEAIEEQALQAMTEKNYKKAEKLLKQCRKVEATIQNDLLLGLCQYGRKRKLGALMYFKEALEKDSSNQATLRLIRSLKLQHEGMGYLLWKTIMRY